jgi:hypothetical protein
MAGGRSVAQYIGQQAKGQPMTPVMIDNLCYMWVNTEPNHVDIT